MTDLLPQVIEKYEDEADQISDEIDIDIDIDNEDKQGIEEEIIDVEPRKRVDTNEVFKKKSIKFKDELVVEKVKKPKRKMSEAQLENLKKARIKAMETRRRNKELREKGEKIPTKKEIIKEKEIEDKKPIVHNHITNNITKEDIIEISKKSARDALVDYEVVRKKRKEQKKKTQEEENHKKKVRQTIEQATQPSYKNNNPFAMCY